MAKLRTDMLKEQLATFRSQLEEFARKHKVVICIFVPLLGLLLYHRLEFLFNNLLINNIICRIWKTMVYIPEKKHAMSLVAE